MKACSSLCPRGPFNTLAPSQCVSQMTSQASLLICCVPSTSTVSLFLLCMSHLIKSVQYLIRGRERRRETWVKYNSSPPYLRPLKRWKNHWDCGLLPSGKSKFYHCSSHSDLHRVHSSYTTRLTVCT